MGAIQAHSELRPLVNDNGIHYGEQIKNYARYHSQDTDVFQPMYPCEKIMKQYYTAQYRPYKSIYKYFPIYVHHIYFLQSLCTVHLNLNSMLHYKMY